MTYLLVGYWYEIDFLPTFKCVESTKAENIN